MMPNIEQVKTALKVKLALSLSKTYKAITAIELAGHSILDASLTGRGAIASLIGEKLQQEQDIVKVAAMKDRYATWQGKNFLASDLDTDGQLRMGK